MDTLQTAYKIVGGAEKQLEELVDALVKAREFDDIPNVIEILKKVSAIDQPATRTTKQPKPSKKPTRTQRGSRKSAGSNAKNNAKSNINSNAKSALKSNIRSTTKSTTKGSSSPKPARKVRAKKQTAPKGKYPLFIKRQDRLVKVGWSRTKSEEYEQRVSKPTVLEFAKQLTKQVKDDKLFELASLGAFSTPDGKEVPEYQVIMIMMWLRKMQVVEKQGPDGYFLRNRQAIAKDFDSTWGSLKAAK